MFRTHCVVMLVALSVGLANSWEFAMGIGDELRLYGNENTTIKRSTIKFESRNLTALAYDEVHDTMLFVDKQPAGDTVCGYNFSSTESKCFSRRNDRSIHSISYDPVTESVFFTDDNERSVNSISLTSGTNANVNLLIKMEDGIPRDIAVDCCKGYIYWLKTNITKATIEKARLDGTERQIFHEITPITVNATYSLEPHGLAIDQDARSIYWLEATALDGFEMKSFKLNGTENVHWLLSSSISSNRMFNSLSNTVAVTKYWITCVTFTTEERYVLASNSQPFNYTYVPERPIFTVYDPMIPIALIANYKIKDQIQGVDHCDALKRVNCATENDAPLCVQGTKLIGEPFTGEVSPARGAMF